MVDRFPGYSSSSDTTSITSPSDSDYVKPDWIPLQQVAKGVVVGGFHPDKLENSPFANLDLGDVVYAFEVSASGQWYRGYIVSLPLSNSAFHSLSEKTTSTAPQVSGRGRSACSKSTYKSFICEQGNPNVSIGIFPVSFISLKECYNYTHPSHAKMNSYLSQGNTELILGDQKPHPPPLPYLRVEYKALTVKSEPIVDDIISVIIEWYDTYLRTSFFQGDIATVNIVASSIKELDTIRKRMTYGLLTSSERAMARKKAIWQICRTSKILNRGVVVRDPETGDVLLSRGNEVRLAQEQILLALSPNYPEYFVNGYIRPRSHLPKHVMVNIVSIIGEGFPYDIEIIMYLRTKVRRISESLRMRLDQGTSTAILPTILFSDLPLSALKSEVYLVAEFYRNIAHSVSAQIKLPERRGLVVGVTDITRLFRYYAGSQTPFPIRLYVNEYNEPTKANKGWGELATRIIFGSAVGV